MNYLTFEDVLYLHVQAMLSTGDEPKALREAGLLDSAVAQPAATFCGEDLHPTLPVKGAALFRSLIKNHPFIEAFEFVLWVATSSSSVEEIADCLTRKITSTP